MVCIVFLMETIGISVLVSIGLLLFVCFSRGMVAYSYNKAVVAGTDFKKMRSILVYIK